MNNMENITKIEALKKISELEQYIKNFDSNESKKQEMEKLFLELMNQGLRLNINSKEQEINYYNKDNYLIVSIELKNHEVWFRYSNFWFKFEYEFNLNYQQIKMFLNTMVEKYLNCKGFTTAVLDYR